MKYLPVIFFWCLMSFSTIIVAQDNTLDLLSANGKITITPIQHATMMLQHGDKVIFTDPNGGAGAFEGLPKPSLILITDIHGDHFNIETLRAIGAENIAIIAPDAVAKKLGGDFKEVTVMANGDALEVQGVNLEAIPMYNLPDDETSRHPKGRGNGYILTMDKKRIYISGDTEDINEMRELKKIDLAFVCMNLPYTMDVDAAADAVIAFRPRMVVPYHYRGKNGLSDIKRFKTIVEESGTNVRVMLLNWYP
ncbi:L-ascorbate metabolism protein UlaG, beta-lactamase superfamily [Reichenbachiella agariperforans]|uniref:L-ascorbate metabolism protein UlaG, beta-lactamase superfamily n=1 Tax=Reichenbachiella agariperforans TaxID=156994 RepID=A0A1M6W1B5_REIAG|nr:MBL fold metallo-hydrolase [Reichenbachiella agariperforans]SHK87463.1 L-ascorbate metabolism protein UlaG, beta-lactamase superfamily [Reichenbachiella agariperforans]